MTSPSPDTLAREREKLLVTDTELIRRLGVPEKIGRATIRELDKNPRSGFPKKQQIWGDRRYWPAVVAYMEATTGFRMATPQPQRERP